MPAHPEQRRLPLRAGRGPVPDGAYREAIATLNEVDRLAQSSPRPEILAFLALAQYKVLGECQEGQDFRAWAALGEPIDLIERGDRLAILPRPVLGHAQRGEVVVVVRDEPACGLRLRECQAIRGRIGTRLPDHAPAGSVEQLGVLRSLLRQGERLPPNRLAQGVVATETRQDIPPEHGSLVQCAITRSASWTTILCPRGSARARALWRTGSLSVASRRMRSSARDIGKELAKSALDQAPGLSAHPQLRGQRGCIPGLQGTVQAGGGDRLAVGAEGHTSDLIRVSPQGQELLPRCDIPKPDGLVITGGGDAVAVGENATP